MKEVIESKQKLLSGEDGQMIFQVKYNFICIFVLCNLATLDAAANSNKTVYRRLMLKNLGNVVVAGK